MLIFNIDIDLDHLPLKEIIIFAEMQAVTDHILKEYIVTLLVEDKNVLSQICVENKEVGNSLKKAALKDIDQLMATVKPQTEFLQTYIPSIKRNLQFIEYQNSIESIVAAVDNKEMLDKIIRHYSLYGDGKMSKYIAFKWDNELKGVKTPDNVALDQLYCVERQKQELLANTEAFLNGLPANNVLLYGNSGCGKSSMVKAILNQYYQDGLRLVQISKDDLADLPQLISEIRDRNFYYIVFMDDLSFESNDPGYKILKITLDGSIEKQPENILFYATSNRFHLVNENWAERKGEDVHVSDTQNEKLSLSERFGIRISFIMPNQLEYMNIVEGILKQEGIEASEEIKAEALLWASRCNGRSGRTAAQYVNAFIAQLRNEKRS